MKNFLTILSLSIVSFIFAMDNQQSPRKILINKKSHERLPHLSPRSDSVSRSTTPRLDVLSCNEKSSFSDGDISRVTSKSTLTDSPRSESPTRRRPLSNENSPRYSDEESLIMPLFITFKQEWENPLLDGSCDKDAYKDAVKQLSDNLLSLIKKNIDKSASSKSIEYHDPHNTPITPDIS